MVGRVPGRAPELGGLDRAGHAASRFIAETPGRVGPGPSGASANQEWERVPGRGLRPAGRPDRDAGRRAGTKRLGAPSTRLETTRWGATSQPHAGSRPGPRLGVALKGSAASGRQWKDGRRDKAGIRAGTG